MLSKLFNRSNAALAAVLLVSLSASQANASLINSNFSDGAEGLDAWSGETISIEQDFNGGVTLDDAALLSAFTTDGNGSVSISIDTSNGNDSDIFSAFLFQSFSLGALASNESWLLSFNAMFSGTGQLDDTTFVDIALVDENFTSGLTFEFGDFLLGNNTVDVSSFAGLNLELSFGLFNLDASADTLTISNLSLVKEVSEVSAPSTVAIFLLCAFGFMLRKQTK